MSARLSLLAIEFLRTQKFSTSGSYFLCEVPPVRFYLLASKVKIFSVILNPFCEAILDIVLRASNHP